MCDKIGGGLGLVSAARHLSLFLTWKLEFKVDHRSDGEKMPLTREEYDGGRRRTMQCQSDNLIVRVENDW